MSKSLSSNHVPNRFDIHFGLGAGASTLHVKGFNDYFISKGDDMLNLAAKVVPTFQVSEKVSLFTAYTFVSHSLQSSSLDMNDNITKSMFNGHLMNASVVVSILLKSTKKRALIAVTPVDTISRVVVTEQIGRAHV